MRPITQARGQLHKPEASLTEVVSLNGGLGATTPIEQTVHPYGTEYIDVIA